MWLELRLYLVALSTLTRCPLPAWVGWNAEWPALSLRHFPGVGLLVGAGAAAAVWLAGHAWPALVSVLTSMAFSLWFTRARHEAGWALLWDMRAQPTHVPFTSEAPAAEADVQRTPAMPAPGARPLGTAGAAALMLLLALKASALHGLVLRDLAVMLCTLVLAQVWSRAGLVLALWWRHQGPGRARFSTAQLLPSQVDSLCLPVAVLWGVLAAAVAALYVPLPALGLAALALLCTGLVWAQQLKNHPAARSAAALDALQQAGELVVYLAVLAYLAQG